MMTRNRNRSRRGASLIEFALSFPSLLTVLGGVLALSSYISQLHVVSRAARDGARVGSVTLEGPDGDGSLIEAASVLQAQAVLDTTGYHCAGEASTTADDNANCNVSARWWYDDPYHYVTVDVIYPLDVGAMPGFPENVSASFTMLTQQQ